MSTTYDVAVIGVGAMGSSTCYQLARRGKRVLGLEQHSIPHDYGSSHGDSRMIRLVYFEHPDYVPLLHRTYELWEEIQASVGHTLIVIGGGLYMGEADGPIVTGTLRAAAEHDLPHELLDRAELKRRFGQFTVPDSYVGVYEPRGGITFPELAIATFAEQALQHGADLRGHEPVRSWRSDGSKVTIQTDRGSYEAEQLVVCAGAWADRMVKDLGVELSVTRQVLGWVWPRKPERFQEDVLPVWAIDYPDGTLHYGFPMRPERPGFKLGYHARGADADPDALDRQFSDADDASFRDALRKFIPDADGPILSAGVCMYTNTPDDHFILDTHPDYQNVHIACGFSGHGFKFTPVVGEIMADLATNGSTRWPIEFLSLSRF